MWNFAIKRIGRASLLSAAVPEVMGANRFHSATAFGRPERRIAFIPTLCVLADAFDETRPASAAVSRPSGNRIEGANLIATHR